jgi:hypothetical protein
LHKRFDQGFDVDDVGGAGWAHGETHSDSLTRIAG